ncbi:hypothetical protein CYMTET_5747 [Cymbomonas tetramitiformis]|uniref:Patatin n=1 Tax=Cymbomonas tetramitiformis TaxID=36881 RepID=A0AAE0GYJ2_9CHLO|nr:hypothetical protein CYMTET_5747 [Cymbomonas tetramitiformis]
MPSIGRSSSLRSSFTSASQKVDGASNSCLTPIPVALGDPTHSQHHTGWQQREPASGKPSDHFDQPLQIFFSGCSWLSMYHVGVAQALWEAKIPVARYAGASSGSIVATCLACGIPPSVLYQKLVTITRIVREAYLGPLGILTKVLKEGIEDMLPLNAHQLCNGRLEVSLTQLYCSSRGYLANWQVENFDSRQDLINSILTSSYLPFLQDFKSGFFRGRWCLDGGLLHNHPSKRFLSSANVLTISHMPGKAEISPAKTLLGNSTSLHAFFFPWRYRYIAPPLDLLNHLYECGLHDAKRWIKKRRQQQDQEEKPLVSELQRFGIDVVKTTKQTHFSL